MMHDILIVDDEADIRELVSGILEDEGYGCRCAHDGISAMENILARQPSLVILDVWLGDGERDGLKILNQIKRDHPYVPVIMMSGHSTIETAVQAIRSGAYDFIEKPFKTDKLLLLVERSIESAKLKKENDVYKKTFSFQEASLLGNSQSINQLKQALLKAAPTNSRILIKGDTGIGKEGVAAFIHYNSKRAKGPFISFNCSTVGPDQLESELLGTEIMCLDESIPRKIGLIEQAHLGTLFLDEVGSLPMPMQNKLIRILQENQFTRLGSTTKIGVDVRIIAAQDHDLKYLIDDGSFREDLYYRLCVIPITIPPLKARTTDIPVLVEHFSSQISATHGVPLKRFSEDAMIMLQSYAWPGNLRQLKNVIEWVMIMHPQDGKDIITREMLPSEIHTSAPFSASWDKTSDLIKMPLREAREAFEKDYLLAQVNRFGWNISQTARFIGMERSALHRKLKTLGVYDPKDLEEALDDKVEAVKQAS
ncbi:MAG TPA: sigma-54 dependent transcriptional regulator [Alphaproteobacteria bacterium]|nr:sigma-54 dependent transcriptional regulator [Alphaproteobacteria bacterium]